MGFRDRDFNQPPLKRLKTEKNVPDQVISQAKDDSVVLAADFEPGMKSQKPYTLGVSLTQNFTAEQIKEHISSLRQPAGEGIIPEVSRVGKDSCHLCGIDKLFFAPDPKTCFSCYALIKHNTFYYCGVDEMGIQRFVCSTCFRLPRGGDTISLHGISILKKNLQKEKNNVHDEESWVQCDKCELWDHQICALYNHKRDCEGKASYICPRCCLQDLEVGNYKPLPSSASFEANDLPSSMLTDHLEKRLFRRLKQERKERAKALGKNLDEVPGAEDLVVRLVSSVDKQLMVKQQFLDFFRYENFPKDFPYKSKVILLFQKIEGVDVCLFAMYVQEYGADCSRPNHRGVYISYIDSVKYFVPNVRTATGEALRTFVYHELLLGYLDYCKKRGFATCYIWSCTPIKRDDYILYCHPETQKMPRRDKLRHWYKSMLKKAAEESIAVDITNLYDHYFLPRGECNTKITATHLPQFDGDYWSGVVEDMTREVESISKGSRRKEVTKRTLEYMGHNNPSRGATKDVLLMNKLGQKILSVKEDFIVVQLHFACTRCEEFILSGSRWFCNQCRNFQLCARCHHMEQIINDADNTHTCSTRERHLLAKAPVNDFPFDTEDNDIGLDNTIFDDRHTFLSFCHQNHYQFDTLRRAKHSSMMILYHLQNSSSQSVKNSCRNNNSKLTRRHSTRANCGLNNKQTLQLKPCQGLRKMLDLLMHANECQATQPNRCSYPKCLSMKSVFRHACGCKIRARGGCKLCRKTWYLLILHSENCTDSDCRIPRCMDMKEKRKKYAETHTSSQLKTRGMVRSLGS